MFFGKSGDIAGIKIKNYLKMQSCNDIQGKKIAYLLKNMNKNMIVCNKKDLFVFIF